MERQRVQLSEREELKAVKGNDELLKNTLLTAYNALMSSALYISLTGQSHAPEWTPIVAVGFLGGIGMLLKSGYDHDVTLAQNEILRRKLSPNQEQK